MKSLKLLGVALAAAAGPALANDLPVPSFNDAPDLYGHEAFGQEARTTSSRALYSPARIAPMDYGPWIVIPSSGA